MTLHPLHTDMELPQRLNNPFGYVPHPLCLLAAKEVRRMVEASPLLKADAERGKMFGVLVVAYEEPGVDGKGCLGFLAAYSGLLAGHNDWDGFVPPVFDAQQPDGHFKQTEREISDLNRRIEATEKIDTIEAIASIVSIGTIEDLALLKAKRKQMSEELQQWLFRQYQMLNARGEQKDLIAIWQDYHQSPKVRRKYPLPPGGSGDCCAPKLLQYAYAHGLRPVSIGEFWWGESPRAEVRHHGQFYPACRGKCLPILTWMLQGLDWDCTDGVWGECAHQQSMRENQRKLETVYEDEWLAVVNKPAGLLTIPGKEVSESVFTLMRERYPHYDGPLIVHRLDMATSGLLIVTKTKEANRLIQQQFANREVKKKYIALLDGVPGFLNPSTFQPSGSSTSRQSTISLPLRADMLDRPRQVVDWECGKAAVTNYEILAVEDGRTRVALYPHTGRTHQLRVHCAHRDGLGCPIRGDELYGRKDDRLYLHAAELVFTHPATGEKLHITAWPEW